MVGHLRNYRVKPAITDEFGTPPSLHRATPSQTLSTTTRTARRTTTRPATTNTRMDSHGTPATNTAQAEGGRQSFIGGFFQRARPHTRTQQQAATPESDGEAANGARDGGGSRRHRGDAAGRDGRTPRAEAGAGSLTSMLRRRPSALTTASGRPQSSGAQTGATTTAAPAGNSNGHASGFPNRALHHIRLVPHLENQSSLRFDPIAREVREGDPPLRIGRFTDRHNNPNTTDRGGNRLAFKSKVVSRGHAEIWVNEGKFYLKDTKSSSGTFLNHQRLALPNNESRPFPLKDGDIVQLGVDFQGGTQDIYKCVKIRIELGREWQKSANAFNSQAMKALKALTNLNTSNSELPVDGKKKKKRGKGSGQDCCICLFSLSICQSIFVAPCSHAFHYKCIRPLLVQQYPGFSCPLCRTWADLDEDVEVDEDIGSDSDAEMAVDVDTDKPLPDAKDKDKEKPLPPTLNSNNPYATLNGNGSLHPHMESDAEMDPYATAGGGVSDAEFALPIAAERSVMSVDLDEQDPIVEAEAQALRDGGRDHGGTDSEGEVARGVGLGWGIGDETRLGDDDDSSQEYLTASGPLQSQSQPNLGLGIPVGVGRIPRSQTTGLTVSLSPGPASAGSFGRSTSAGTSGGTYIFPRSAHGGGVYSDSETAHPQSAGGFFGRRRVDSFGVNAGARSPSSPTFFGAAGQGQDEEGSASTSAEGLRSTGEKRKR